MAFILFEMRLGLGGGNKIQQKKQKKTVKLCQLIQDDISMVSYIHLT